jgi:hypothetical protein
MLVLHESRLVESLDPPGGLIKVWGCLVRKVRVIAPAGAADRAVQKEVGTADVRAKPDQRRPDKELGKSPWR